MLERSARVAGLAKATSGPKAMTMEQCLIMRDKYAAFGVNSGGEILTFSMVKCAAKPCARRKSNRAFCRAAITAVERLSARCNVNMDHACAIARSIFVINFPNSTSSKDLWKLCQSYGTVVDVYIPNRRSKAGKRFAFVRFINVDNVDRLMGNLCTLWIGRMHLHANV
nr:RNA-directed DNA polymerase, eukaryota, nucleotide-binding alpha-beta plait domain protein [Tanacetum cinerariifolium]